MCNTAVVHSSLYVQLSDGPLLRKKRREPRVKCSKYAAKPAEPYSDVEQVGLKQVKCKQRIRNFMIRYVLSLQTSSMSTATPQMLAVILLCYKQIYGVETASVVLP